MSRYVHNRDHANDIFERGNHMKSQSLRVLTYRVLPLGGSHVFVVPPHVVPGGQGFDHPKAPDPGN